jgi:prevent-host-death family protein
MNTISISELRQNTAKIIKNLGKDNAPVTIMQRSKPQAVLVNSKYFQNLEEAVMDLQDALEAEKAKSEDTLPLEDYISSRWPNQ